MFDRLVFIFLKRYHTVKPMVLFDDNTKWLNNTSNVLEELQDDLSRYGVRQAWQSVKNFAEVVFWRNQLFTERLSQTTDSR